MKKIKNFENFTNEGLFDKKPKVGDYVILSKGDSGNFPWGDSPHKQLHKDYEFFIENNIGQIIDSKSENWSDFGEGGYKVKYENIPSDILHLFKTDDKINYYVKSVTRSRIVHFSKDKNELESILAANKHNM